MHAPNRACIWHIHFSGITQAVQLNQAVRICPGFVEIFERPLLTNFCLSPPSALGRSLPLVNTVCTGQVEYPYPLTFRLRGCGAQSRVSEANGLNQLLCFCVEDKRIVSVCAFVRLPQLRKTKLAKQVMHRGIFFTCSGKACLAS